MRIPQMARRVVACLLLFAAIGARPGQRTASAQTRGAPARVRPGAVTALVLPVAGMTCALCTRGIEESVRLLENVVLATADLSTGLVRVQAAEGRSLVINDVRERVRKAGFKPVGECDLEAIGRFHFGADRRITFRVPETPYAFQTLEGNELKRLMRIDPGLKGEFFLAFRLHDHPRWKPSAISIMRGESRAVGAAAAGR